MTVDCKAYYEALSELNAEARKRFGTKIMFDDAGYIGSKPIQMGVNWAAIGATTPEETVEFAHKLIEASEMAKSFKYNDYTVQF